MSALPEIADRRELSDPSGRLLRDLLLRGLPLEALPAATRLVTELEALAAERCDAKGRTRGAA